MNQPDSTGSSWDPTEATQGEEEETFLQFLGANWLWWATPMVLVLVALLLVVFLAQDSEVAPFIYALF